MAIEKLKSGKYRVRIYQKGKKIHSSPVLDKKKDAEMYETEFKNRALKKTLGLTQDTISIYEALSEFSKKISRCTEEHQKNVLNVLAKFIDEYRISIVSEFTNIHIQHYIRNFKLSPCTLSRNVSILKHFGKFLYEESYLSNDHISRIKKPEAKNLVEKRALTNSELKMLFKAIENVAPVYYNIALFSTLTGCRKMESVTLEWENINFQNLTIRIYDKPHIILKGKPFKCKWGSTRTIPISSELSELLLSIPKKTKFVFTNSVSTTFHNNFSRDFKKAVMASGIERPSEVSLHSLRHTWITHALENGLDIRSVSEYAGHKNITTTQKYLHSLSSQEKMEMDSEKFLQVHTNIQPLST